VNKVGIVEEIPVGALKCYLPGTDRISMSVIDTLPIEVRRTRPPTAVYPDRHSMERFRDQEFPATAAGWTQVVYYLNLEGGFFAPGALRDLILPVAQGIRSGAYGSAVLVIVTSDDGTAEFLESLAERHDLAFFILSSPDLSLSHAHPVGSLTSTDVQTLSLLREAGGEVTSSRVASLAGIEVNAAVNRLRGLAQKGFVYRVNRSRREGDAFVDLLVAADRMAQLSPESEGMPIPSAGDFDVPQAIRADVRALAVMQGSEPAEVLVRAWREFIDRHREALEEESEHVGRLLREGDTEGLTTYANRYARERAEEAASRNDDS
jgi:hypothetical protein